MGSEMCIRDSHDSSLALNYCNTLLVLSESKLIGEVYPDKTPIEEMEMLDVPDNVLPYFDFEAYASHLQEHGKFLVTEHGIFELPE